EAVGGEFELARSDVPVGRGQHVRGLAVGAGGEARLVALCGIQIRKEVWGVDGEEVVEVVEQFVEAVSSSGVVGSVVQAVPGPAMAGCMREESIDDAILIRRLPGIAVGQELVGQ